MAFAFKINNVDFSDCISIDNYKVKHSDLDSEEAGRSLDTIMHRRRLGSKITITAKCVPLTQARIQALAAAMRPEFITVYFTDFKNGNISRSFYGTDIESAALGTFDGVQMWKDASFTLVEE